ncbi:MAG: hypothetical protein NWR45_02875 [Candidatus Nanopelagicales bacterium]|nr:hypothetical protein [Candidatus Nanopelagicales bacterium]
MRALFLALFAVVVALGLVAPANAIGPAATLVSDTQEAKNDVATFRTTQNQLLNSYVQKYSSRFTPTESAAFTNAQTKADRSLLALQRATAKTDRLAQAGASKSRINKAAKDAQRSYERAVTAATDTQTSLEPILRNRLSLGEAFSAYRDYSGAMGNFEDIGAQLDAIAERTKPGR